MNFSFKQNRTQALVIVLVVLVAISGFGYGAAFMFVRNKAFNVSQKTQELVQKNQQELRLDSVQALVRDTINERDLIKNYFVTEETVAEVIEFIEGLGVGPGAPSIVITSVSANTPDGPRDFGELTVHLTTSGSWQQVVETIHKLESAPYAIGIRNVRLAGPSVDASSTEDTVRSWTATIELDVQMIARER